MSSAFFRLPAELLREIAEYSCAYRRRDLIQLCRINKFCNIAMTPALYASVWLETEREATSFSDTILLYRPGLALSVKKFVLDTSNESVSSWDDAVLTISRVAEMLTTCVNLHTLSVLSDVRESCDSLCFLFKSLSVFPHLRHLNLELTLDNTVLEFLERHYRQLCSLSIQYAHDPFDEPFLALVAGLRLRVQFHLPLSCTSIDCSPILVPIFLPDSSITDVSMSWPVWDDLAVDQTASLVVKCLAASGGPVKELRYETNTWNSEFVRLASAHLPRLESLTISNVDETWRVLEDPSDEEAFNDKYFDFMELLDEHIEGFRSLKSLTVFCCARTELSRYDYDDFKTTRRWASLCPTLLHCDLPSSCRPWDRHPDFDFFVPSSSVEERDEESGSSELSWCRTLLEEEGTDFAAAWRRQYTALDEQEDSPEHSL